MFHFAHQKADFHCGSKYLPRGITTGSPSSKYEHRRAAALLRNIQNIRICIVRGKKPYTRHTATRYRTIKFKDYFLSKHHQPNIKRHAHHFFVKKMEQGQRYNDAILNELISFFKILLNHTFKIHRTFFLVKFYTRMRYARQLFFSL